MCLLALTVFAPDSMQAQQTVTNTASADYGTIAGTDSVASNPVETTLVFPELFIQKMLGGPTQARVGDEVSYSIRYGNSSDAVEARDVVLADTLPNGLEFVSSQPPGQANGQVITWDLGQVAPGDTSDISLTVRVTDDVQDTLRVRNLATLAALNSSTETAMAPEIELVAAGASQLSLEKSADVLEVGLGETVPYTLTLENTGLVPLQDLRIHDRLPEGGRYSRGSLIGADSIHTDGRDLTIFVSGPLAPGATHTVRYAVAIVSAKSDVIENRAYATADDEFVRSDEAVAWIRVRSAWPMETRAGIGKVWVDLDGDGGQDDGEPGVEGVSIWTDDGAVATTDSEGKFSYRNLRPGHHAFRLDPTTLPAAYRLAEGGAGEDLVTLDADGWTTPRINFRLVPRGARLAGAQLPVSWRFTARPLCTSLDELVPSAESDRATLARFETNSARPAEQSGFLERLARELAERPECRAELVGHADRRPIQAGPYPDNWQLSRARADSVARQLQALGLDAPRLAVRASGASRPLATGEDPYSLWLNRRVELRLVGPQRNIFLPERPVVEYEVIISNDYDVPLEGLSVRFEPAVDSAAVFEGDSMLSRQPGRSVSVPEIPPHTRLRIKGWTVARGDSAVAILESDGPAPDRLFAQVHNFVLPVQGVTAAQARADSLPSPHALPQGGSVRLQIEPVAVGWPEVTHPLPDGWVPVDGSVRVGGVPGPDPEIRRDRTGKPILYWRFRGRDLEAITLELRPADDAARVETVRVPALRTEEERQAEKKRAFLEGPAVEIFDPIDGTVYRSDQVYVGVRGEPGAAITLFDGDSVLARGNVRIDGIHDFIGIGLTRGPHRLRVRMKNSWNKERWDSVAVHVTGTPSRFAPERERVQLRADGHTTEELRVRVLDDWGVPVVNPAYVTVTAEGAEPVNPDADRASVGHQVRTDPAGWLTIELRPGHEVQTGMLRLESGETSTEIELEILPATRPLMITGVGRIGLGASADPFGAITARGRIDDRTTVTLSYDSRRLDAGRDFFGRASDPLERAQYPLLGDASQRRTVSASEYAFFARVERGFDWLALGDISTAEFTSGLQLTRYQRSLAGIAGRVTTGPIVWKGFGATTSQNIKQVQIRGTGSSGPYELQPEIRPGTETIALETRDRDNAQRILSRQTLVRFIDYQIDYERGTLLFKRPVPATDPSENPIFIVVSYEAESGAPQKEVWGLRAVAGSEAGVGTGWLDSMRVGATWIRDGQPDGKHQLVGADLRLLRYGGLDVGAEVSYSQTPDSSGVAAALDGSLSLFAGAVNLSAGWMKVGDEFHNPSNVGLRGGTEELRVGGGVKVGPTQLRVEHERQEFDAQGVERQRTTGGIVQSLGPLQLDAGVAADRFAEGGEADESQAGELKLTWRPNSRFSLWTDARHQFNQVGDVIRPDFVGGGAAFRVNPNLSLEARHRQVILEGDTTNYAVTNLGVRSELGFGTQAWGSYQIAGGADGAHNAAVVGLNNRLSLGPAFRINTLFERRFGINGAPVADPVRSLPFLQAEEDYWTAALGLELLPQEAPYRLTTRGEYRDGDLQSTRLVTLAGDVSINRSLAILSRQEFLEREQTLGGSPTYSRKRSSLWGLAFRPIDTDALNVLTKFEWVDETNPIGGGVFTQQGQEERVIGVAETIWSPFTWTELGARFAMRRTLADRLHEDGTEQQLESWADYVGGRLHLDIARWLAVRTEGRLLMEHTSDTRRWDAAPSLVLTPIEGFEVAGGYRFGDLHDPDFAVRGGHGWFVTFGARLTERVFPTAADFWRPRL